jgi:diguanylate cyclase (GGDEF)-like protein/PAS domain S-box-containing protein
LPGQLSPVVILSQTPVFVANPQGIALKNHDVSRYLPPSFTLRTLIQLPVVADQTVLGLLSLASAEFLPEPEAFEPWGQNLASYIARLIQSQQLATQLAVAQQRLELAAANFKGFVYDWDLQSNQVLRFPSNPRQGQGGLYPVNPTWQSWLAAIHPKDRSGVEALLQKHCQGQDHFALEYQLGAEGQPGVPLCDRGTILRDDQGHPIRIVGTVLDTSEYQQTALIAQQQMAQYQTLLSAINVVIFQTDLAGNLTFLNAIWPRLTGHSVQESLQQSLVDFVHPQNRQGYREAFQNLVNRTAASYHHEIRYLTKHGGSCWLEVYQQVLKGEDGTLLGTTGTLVDITDRKQTEKALLHDALHDGLTELPNRILFLDRLQQACHSFERHQEEIFAVLFLDLDRFKIINDTLGHLVGDQLLVAVAHRLRACLRPEDTVARLGGDEFTLLLPNIERVEDAIHISNRILQTLSLPFSLENTEIFISTSIGIAMSDDPNHKPEDLLRHADIALYRAKASGKGCYAVFSLEMPLQPLAQVQMGTELRQALEDEDFRLYCQPILSLETNQVWGFTLEMYWQHPSKGLLPPTAFIPSAMQTGLIVSMGWWLLRKACQQLRQWQRLPCEKPLGIYLAVCEQQLATAGFMAKFQRILDKEEMDPNCLILELPDVLWSQLDETVLLHLQQLRSQGIQFARNQNDPADDWLTRNNPLPIDWIKLSPTFLGNLEQEGYVESVHSLLSLAQKQGIRMIADGIHTPKQQMLMSALHCDYGQGSYFSTPLPVQQADLWLESSFSQPLDRLTPSPSMSLLIIYSPIGQSQVPLVGQRTWTIGRSPDNTIVLPDRWASRNHAQLRTTAAGEYYLIDLGSGNGSVVNGERVTIPVLLKDGDLITIGHSQLEFHNRAHDSDTALSGLEIAPKNVLMMQASHLQGQVWKETLSSQGISLTWLNENIDLAQYITQSLKSGQKSPDLLLLDMTILKPNPYSFCRWCHNLHPDLKIILTSGTRTFVPASERKWANHQGASELIAAFDENSIFSNVIDVMAKVRVVLSALNWRPVEQSSISTALLSIKASTSTPTFSSSQTIIGELPPDLDWKR